MFLRGHQEHAALPPQILTEPLVGHHEVHLVHPLSKGVAIHVDMRYERHELPDHVGPEDGAAEHDCCCDHHFQIARRADVTETDPSHGVYGEI